MLVFNNQQRSGFDELSSYGPRYYLGIQEMVALYKFAGNTIDLMAEDLEQVVAVQFIDTMNHEAVSRMEVFFGITLDVDKSLDHRKSVLKAIWLSTGRLSKSKIIEIVHAFVPDSCHVKLIDSNIVITIEFQGNPKDCINDIRELINRKMPAHLGIIYRVLMDLGIVFRFVNRVTVESVTNRMNFYLYTGYLLDGRWCLDGSVEILEDYTMFTASVKNKVDVVHEEVCTNKLITKHNDWYLDGTFLMDGFQTLDPWVKEEVL